MKIFKRSTALLLVLCLVLGFALSASPMASSVHAVSYDPYVYVLGPDSSAIPTYYHTYARPFVGWSAHEVGYYDIVRMFNLTNVGEVLPEQPENFTYPYASVATLCCDHGTPYRFGAKYRALNLEDAYFSKNGNQDRAKHVRAIVRHSLPYKANALAVQNAANAYFGSNKVNNLTNGELAAATQAALWHFTNSDDFGTTPYFCTVDFKASGNASAYASDIAKFISTSDPLNVYEKETSYTENNINRVYQYLIALPGEEATDIMIDQSAVSVEKTVFTGSGNDGVLTLFVDIDGTVDGDDELLLSAMCGDQTETVALGKGGIEKTADGLFPITLTGVTQADASDVELELTGKQTVNDAVFFEAQPKNGYNAREASQGFGGYGAVGNPVYSALTVNPLANTALLEITKVDEQSGNTLSGVSFDLYMKQDGDDLKLGSYTTDANGKITAFVTDAGDYYFVETKALAGYEPVTGNVTSGRVPNSWNAGALEVSKKLINTTPAQVGETFNFKLTLDLSTAPVVGNGISWMTDTYLMEQLDCSKELSWNVSGDKELTATFTLNADEEITINSIPLGATYTLEEIMTEEDRAWFTVTTKVDNGTEQRSNTAQGTVAEKNAVLFTNSVVTDELKLGSLAVSKELVNTTPAQVGETFNFQITVDFSTADASKNGAPWMDEAYLLDQITCSESLSWTEKDGKYIATFTVDADETVTIEGIAQGTSYTVKELLTKEEREWFAVTSKVGSGAAVDSDTAAGTVAEKNSVLFTNSVVSTDVQLRNLAISKKLINTTPAQVGETFNFKISVDFSTADAYKNAAPWLNDQYLLEQISCAEKLSWTEKDGKYTATFTVDADETVVINGIAQGTTYTVAEILTEEDRAWFAVTSKVGNEPMQNSSVAEGSVGELNAILFTNTVATGDELRTGDLTVSKKLVNTTPAQVGETFHFEVAIDLSDADVYDDPAPWLNDEYLLGKISSTENLTWTEKDGKHTATFTVDADETVTIRGLAYGVTYTVKEILTTEDRERFTVTGQVNSEEAKNTDTVAGTIAQRNAVVFTNAVVTTDVQLGDLAVSKKLVNTTPAQVGETFNFQISVDFSSADAYKKPVFWMNDAYLLGFVSSTENLTWTEKDGKYTATFTVDAEETVTIEGLAYGATYTVEEIMTAEDRAWFTVTSKVGNEPMQDSNSAQGSIADLNAILFTNSVVTDDVKLGDLDISKRLINTTPAEVGETFNFKITVDFSTADVYTNAVPWMNDEYLLGKISSTENLTWTAENGKYTAIFTVDADETVTVKGLAYGTTYTVEEILTEDDREWFESTSQIGDTVAGSVAQSTVAERNAVIFTNSVVTGPVLTTGSVEVSKKLVNTTPAVVGETFNFQITIDLSTADVYANAAPWMNDAYLMSFINSTEALTWTAENGKYTATFTVNADETFSINGIAQGSTYTVQEILTAEDREWFTVTSQIGEAEATDSNIVASTVAENNAVLFTNSVVTGPELQLGDPSVSKKLINTTPAEVRETFDFQITVDFSTADVYTNAAPWMNDEYLLSFINSTENLNWTEKDGKYTATFTVNADETVTIAGLAYGATYTMQEILTEEDREWFTVTCRVGEEAEEASDTAESTVGENNAIVFTNTVVTGPELVTGAVEVSKKLVNTTPAKVGETFNFQITVDFSTADVYTNAAPWMNDEYLLSLISSPEDLTWTEAEGKYTATFTVDADETVTIEGLACGTTYTVQEILTEEDREWFTTTCQIGEEEATESDTVESTVAENNAVLFTNTVVTGMELSVGTLHASKKLENATEAQANEEFEFSITIDFSAADIYQDPAPWMYDEYLLDQIECSKEVTWTKVGEKKYAATFKLKSGEGIEFNGLAENTGYTLEEILTKQERNFYRVTTTVVTNGGSPVNGKTSLISGNIGQDNAIVFTNTRVEQIPITDDLSMGMPLALCLISILAGVVLVLNKRRFIG